MVKIIKLNLIFLLFYSFNIVSFTISSFFANLSESYRAEYIIYKLLNKRPLNNKINVKYIYAPWRNILKHIGNIHNISKSENSFTVCSHDEYLKLIPFFRSIGINVIFNASGHDKKFDGIDLVTIPYFARNSVKPAKVKDIFYSFIGSISHKSRNDIINMKHPKNTIIIKRNSIFHYNETNRNLLRRHEKEYADVLARSRFSLCPRGHSPGTYRFWESLAAGAIPVLIADNYKLPIGFNWNKCIVRIKEQDINKIPEILSKITPEIEAKMRKNCIRAYSLYSGKNFDRVIRLYYNRLYYNKA